GAAPIQRALMEGDPETGVCLQVMVRKLDAGPVLGARKFKLTSEMNAFDSYKLCEELGAKLLETELMDYVRGNLTPIPQDESLTTYAGKIEKSEALVDWSADATTVHNKVRGLAMGPVAYTLNKGKMLKIHKSRPTTKHSASLRPGQVLEVTEKSLLVQCGKGSLELLEVQPESRANMQINEYLRGYPMKTGDSISVDDHASKEKSSR
ncbi:MAG: methionyl-tRNA formyltransferase, partial [Bdellovibrionales bacterium]